MKPTVRVSIGGTVFNLEEDAYQLLNGYLERLRQHFAGNETSQEITNDIEMRLSELLQMRISPPEAIVSLSDATSIIAIMGNPQDFGDNASTSDSEQAQNTSESDESTKWSKRRLYRDMNRRILGGVCNGLGHYFRIDPVLVRIVWVLLFIVACFFGGNLVPLLMLAYVILWGVMPQATTFEAKMAMTGANPSIYNVADRESFVQQPYWGSVLGNLVRTIAKFVGWTIAVCLFISLLVTIGVLIWAYIDTDLIYARNYLTLIGWDSFAIKSWLAVLIFVPLFIVFFILIKLCTASRFRVYNFGLIAVGVVLWIAGILYFVVQGMSITSDAMTSYENKQNLKEEIGIRTKAKTLVLKIDDSYLDAKKQPLDGNIRYRTTSNGKRELFIIPHIRSVIDSTLTTYSIDVKQHRYGINRIGWNAKVATQRFDYQVSDSVITISPIWYSNSKPWGLDEYEVIIRHPEHIYVEIDYPLHYGIRF